jgi:hypothetical protein
MKRQFSKPASRSWNTAATRLVGLVDQQFPRHSLHHYNTRTLNWFLGKECGKMTYWRSQRNNMCLLFSRQIQQLNPEANISGWFSDQFRLWKQTTDKIAQVYLRLYVNEALSMKQDGSNSVSTTYWLPINNPFSSQSLYSTSPIFIIYNPRFHRPR